ncbi:ShlB/FhaC/HecB family hemolysin secretion/activation protein [Pseudomonas syringae group sp. J309-1]|uniref:ShlB/FhaC/HecB family hemolysin secretion/activation protein n=1 Tax=Pseudomonas syringae group sp. J309-1 TaxID=3079588 RepID=UPI002910BCB8|nr:ShlB/FhaC/HecB family hemolysin secretion/activation protein [Pseudomonas syringae group sp. J309-1]MDU8359245.1 ShlB/FhaC/HecB family hemolysin secretion/activation protein [Pseudomonas syringae group sp. J309-1]
MALPFIVYGAPTPGEQDLIRDRQDRLLQEQRRRLEELKDLPGSQKALSAPAAPMDTRCFPIKTIRLKGADLLSTRERDALLEPFVGQCLAVAQLNGVLKAVTDHYLAKGLVTTRAYLPQQDLSQGTLEVLVVEGKLESLKGEAGSGLSERELAMAFPGLEGQELNLREIEQLLDQLNRLPSNQAQMELAPGNAVGGSTVLVKNTPQKPWRASLARHNDGQKSTGEQQWGVGLDWDSPLGLADQLNLRGGHDAVSDHKRTYQSNMLSYSLPWGWWNFSYSYSDSEYRTLGQGAGFDFKYTGESQTHQLRAERVIHRDAKSKTTLSTGLSHLRTRNFIEDSELANASQRITEAQFGVSHGRVVGSAFANLELGMQQGIGALDAMGEGRRANNEPTARYRKYTATLSYLQPFQIGEERFTFSSLATGQRSEDMLYNSQRFSVSGQSAVRGYKEQFLSGDSGGYWRNDLRWTRPVTLEWLQPVLQQYGLGVGYDQGVIRRDAGSGGQNGRVSSNSLELFARGKHVSASVTFAHSLERPAALSEREAPIYFRLELTL